MRLRKNIICFAAVFLFASVCIFSQQYWIRQPSPTDKSLNKSFFVDTLYGWAVGDSGIVIHTSNGGLNWVVQPAGIGHFPMDDVFFINRTTGWIISNDFFFTGTTILSTTDGGTNWQNYRYPDSSVVFNTIYFLDENTGFLSGYSGFILKTTNAGGNWVQTHVDTAYCPMLNMLSKHEFAFINSTTGFACGGHLDIVGIIWKTTDAGLNWVTYCVASEPLYDIKVISPSKIIAAGGDFEYGLSTVVSYDTGNTWLYRETGLFGEGRSLAFRTPEELWVPTVYSLEFALSKDTGSHSAPWLEIPTPDSIQVKSALFVTPTFGWAFGSGGAILKYNTAVIGLGEQEQIPKIFKLFQNYPNPFNPETKISFNAYRSAFVSLSVYDVNGALVEVLMEQKVNAGVHEAKWDGSKYASGVYFYSLKAGDFSESKKMLLIK
jgi:photosystem II stability/assembly factor-like uncharacterized protein